MPTASERRQANQERENKIRGQQANYATQNFEPPKPGYDLPMGAEIKTIESSRFGGKVVDNWFSLPLKKLFEHVLIIGAPGAGKTFLLLWMAYCIIFNKDEEMDLIVVDGKGSAFFAKMICLMAHIRGWGPVPVVRVGWPDEDKDGKPIHNSAVFDMLGSGSSRAIWNRLVALFDLNVHKAESDWYRIFKRNMFQRVCGYNMEEIYPDLEQVDPPRSLKEVWERLTPGWMWDNYPEKSWDPDGGSKKVVADLLAFRQEVEETMLLLSPITGNGKNGFRLGSRRVILFSLRKNAERHVAELFFRVLGDYSNHYIAQQADGVLPRKTILMVDEFGVFDSDVMTDIVKTSREAQFGVIMAAQTPTSLGEYQAAEELIACIGTTILMRSGSAERLITIAGTRKMDDISYTTRDGEFQGTTVREKEVLKIDPNDVKNLENGEAFITTLGWTIRIQGGLIKFNIGDFKEEMEDLSVRQRPRRKESKSQDSQTNPNESPS